MAKRRTATKLDQEIARLYSLALDEFTEARNETAKRLRGAGEGADADVVKAQKKPSLPAWAINQAARSEPKAVKRLLSAGERLAQAQDAALAGGGGDELKYAMSAQNAAVEGLMESVDAALAGAAGASILDRARETLRAVASDEGLRDELAAGRLTRDREAVGFGGEARAPAPRRAAEAERRDARAKRRIQEGKQTAKRAKRSLDAAAKRASEAKRRLDRAQESLEAAQQRLDQAESQRRERAAELAEAEAALSELGR